LPASTFSPGRCHARTRAWNSQPCSGTPATLPPDVDTWPPLFPYRKRLPLNYSGAAAGALSLHHHYHHTSDHDSAPAWYSCKQNALQRAAFRHHASSLCRADAWPPLVCQLVACFSLALLKHPCYRHSALCAATPLPQDAGRRWRLPQTCHPQRACRYANHLLLRAGRLPACSRRCRA